MRVAIVDVLGLPYDGSTLLKRGLGGSESAIIYISRELVKLGIEVDVYCDCNSLVAGATAHPGMCYGVHYMPVDHLELRPRNYDVVIASRSVKPFTNYRVCQTAKHKVLWLHDTFCDGDDVVESMVVNNQIDEIWTLSDWHTTYISQCTHGHRRMMEVLKRKIWVTRNGAHAWRDVNIKDKQRHKFVFNASITKGMTTLVNNIWPRVREQIPKAELTIIGGAYTFKKMDQQGHDLATLTKEHDGKNGIKFTGVISQPKIADILCEAGFMIYPQSFPETFGISTLESLVYGTPVISGRFGAMEETAVDDACYLMDYPVDSNVLYTFNKDAHVDHFVKMTVDAYNNPYLWQQKCNKALIVREVCEWETVAKQWKQHLFKKLGLYLPLNEYHEVMRISSRTHEIFNRRWSNPEEWCYYPEVEKRIDVIVPFYNAEQYIRKCIESIATQNYENFHIWLIDDASTDGGFDIADACCLQIDNAYVHRNTDRVGALANQISQIQYFQIPAESIIVLIDGDDALTNDPNIFKKINRLYHEGAQFTYGSMWSMADNIPLIAQEYPKDIIDKGAFRDYKFPWNMPYTHLRTFKRDLFDSIELDSLRDSNGNYYKAGGDAALFYALIEKCPKNGIRAVRDVTYIYNDLNPLNDYKINSEEQTKNANEILAKKDKALKKILIAIPTAQNIHPETFKSIYNLEVPDGYETHFQYFFGYRVDQVRNLIADWTIKGFDYLFAVDYDIAFEPDALKRLLAHDKDVVSGLYVQRLPGRILEVYRENLLGNQYNVKLNDLNDGLNSIAACGFGCVLVKKEVFEKIGYPQFEYHPALTMDKTVSEDVDFCNKARKAGFEIFADTKVPCRHFGMTEFTI